MIVPVSDPWLLYSLTSEIGPQKYQKDYYNSYLKKEVTLNLRGQILEKSASFRFRASRQSTDNLQINVGLPQKPSH